MLLQSPLPTHLSDLRIVPAVGMGPRFGQAPVRFDRSPQDDRAAVAGHMPSPIDFHIRDFQPGDSAAVNQTALRAWEEYRRLFSDSAQIFELLGGTANLAAEAELIVAESGSSIVGVVLYVAPGRPREAVFPAEWSIIRMLSVMPQARGRGIGRKLTEECIRRARRDGAQVIGLHTSPPAMGVALGLYGRIGFAFDRNIPDRHGVPYAIYRLAL